MLVNHHLKIEPIEYQSFISTDKGQFDEIGVVIDKDPELAKVEIGKRVYFDSFLAHKIPNPENPQKFFWYVKFEELFDVI